MLRPDERSFSGSALRAAVLAVGMALTAQPALSEDRIACSVEAVDGRDARLWSQGMWRGLKPGADIARDAIIITGEATRAKVTCSDGLVLTVGVGTEINLESLAGQRTGRVSQLVRGVLGVFSPRRLREGFKIRTPVATASVDASQSLVEYTPEKGAAVFVRDGSASVASLSGASARLAAGEGVSVDASGDAGPVKTWGQARIDASTSALGFDWSDG